MASELVPRINSLNKRSNAALRKYQKEVDARRALNNKITAMKVKEGVLTIKIWPLFSIVGFFGRAYCLPPPPPRLLFCCSQALIETSQKRLKFSINPR